MKRNTNVPKESNCQTCGIAVTFIHIFLIMNCFLPALVFMVWPVVSFHTIFTKTVNNIVRHSPKETAQIDKSRESHSQMHEFKTQMILGVVNSIAGEIVAHIPPDTLLSAGVDDVISTVPHSVLAEVLDGQSIALAADGNVTKEYKLVLVPVKSDGLKNASLAVILRNDTVQMAGRAGHVSFPVQQARHKSTERVAFVHTAIRYLLPPIAFQVVPRIMVQCAIQFAHEHYHCLQHLAHFFNFAGIVV